MTYTKDAVNKSFLLGSLNEWWDLIFCFLGPCAKEMSVFCTSLFCLRSPLSSPLEAEAEYFVPHHSFCSVSAGRPQTSILDLSNKNTIQSFWLAWDILVYRVSNLIHTWTVGTDKCTFWIIPTGITYMCFLHTCSVVWFTDLHLFAMDWFTHHLYLVITTYRTWIYVVENLWFP